MPVAHDVSWSEVRASVSSYIIPALATCMNGQRIRPCSQSRSQERALRCPPCPVLQVPRLLGLQHDPATGQLQGLGAGAGPSAPLLLASLRAAAAQEVQAACAVRLEAAPG